MKPELVSGSPLWQTVFVSFAAVLILFQIARGWRLGLPRQLVRIAAVVVSYGTAIFGGRMLLPILRPLLKAPDFVISALGGVVVALIVYSVINTVGAILFRRTGQQQSAVVRLVYGVTGGVLGIFFGLFFLWVIVIGIRSLGAIGDAQVNAGTPPPRTRASRTPLAANVRDENTLAFSLARLKKSIELGTVGELVRQTDLLPSGIYETLAKVGEVFAKQERATRFLSYPGVMQLADSPKILALRADPEIIDMIQNGRVFDLLQDNRLIEAANDPELAAQLKKFDLRKALDFAAQTSAASSPNSGAEYDAR